MNTHAKILKNQPAFAGLSSRILNRLTEHSRIEEVGKGEIICREGDPCDALLLLLSGRCQSVLLSPGGGSQVLDIYSPGDTFGERALLSHDRHWTTVQVITDSVLLRLDGEDIHALLDKTPRLVRQLVKRLKEHMRRLSAEVDTVRAELGRVVCVACLTKSIHGGNVTENLSLALRKETGASVLSVRLLPGDGVPRLRDWVIEAPENGAFQLERNLGRGEEDVFHLGLFVSGGTEEIRRIASLIGHMGRFYRFVVISADVDICPEVANEFQRQSDLAYVLFGQSSEDLSHANRFIRSIREGSGELIHQVRPVVCLERDERGRPFRELKESVGVPIHSQIHGFPSYAGASDTHYLTNPTDRFSANVRYLAREIGRCRIGLALSSGGAKGYAHIGAIQVLEENDIRPDVIAGSSMGAYIGALRAFGLRGSEIETLALELEGRFGLLKVLDPVLPPRRGFIHGNRFKRLLEETLGDAHFSDMSLQLRVVATDLETLERVVYDSGQVSPVVKASMAMPGVVTPVSLDGRTFVDGGASEPLPVDVLIEMGVEKIIAVNTIANELEMKDCVLSGKGRKEKKSSAGRNFLPSLRHYLNYFESGNILDVVSRSMHAIQTRVAEGACKQADVVIRAVACDGTWYDYGNPRKYMKLGRCAAEEQLPDLKALASGSRGQQACQDE